MSNKALKIINIVLAIAFTAVGIYVFFPGPDKYVDSKMDGPKNPSSNNSPESGSENSSHNGNNEQPAGPITKLLFGEKASAVQETTEESTTYLPAWYKLKGTITGPETLARAILNLEQDTTSFKVSILKIGDNTNDGFILTEVHKDFVVFAKNGYKTKLWIKKDNKYSDMTPETEKQVESQENIPLRELQLPEKKTENKTILDSMAIDSDWVEVKNNNEKTVGLMLENIKPLSPLAMTGLRSGDIVKSINNQQLTGFQKAYQVLQKAKFQDILKVEVIRNDETKTFETKLE